MSEEQKEMFEGGIKRASRANQTREKTAQRKPWSPPSMLDAPPAPDGYKHRWIRAETRGFDDTKNISAKMRGSWTTERRQTMRPMRLACLPGISRTPNGWPPVPPISPTGCVRDV